MTDMIFPETLFKPWAGNPLKSRADVEAALKALVEPVEQYRSAGGARIRLDAHAAHFDEASADLEGYSRLLWGLAPAEVGGATWIDWTPIARGLASGCDPAHPEYWGDPFDRSQRLVELAAIGFALRLVPDKLWAPLSTAERRNVAAYLLKGHACEYSDNNWKFFRLLVSMGLRHVGVDCDRELDDQYRQELDAFYLGDGWYHDGDTRRADHYIPFAFHFYGLILAALDGGDWTKRYRERARLIAGDMARWFADDGPALCFGRSMTYRFAIAGLFGAMALAGDEEIPFGQQKGYFLRHLRWWAKHPFAARDGVMPVGYAYPNLIMSEPYNSAQSPYWALKAFLPLMLPADHPFWASDEDACPQRSAVSTQRHIGFLVANPAGDAIALSCGQHTSAENTFIRFAPEKYAKFAYSGRYGFSIENDLWRFDNSVLESMIGFSDDGVHFRVRETNEEALVADNLLYARWRPFADVLVETWLYWDGDFQVRLHRIDTPRTLATIEGGFAVGRDAGEVCKQGAGRAVVATATDLSAILDIGSTNPREGRCHIAAPNTNLVSAKTLVPQLRGTVPVGVSTLAVAVLAQADATEGTRKLSRLPAAPDVGALRRRVSETGTTVTLMRGGPL